MVFPISEEKDNSILFRKTIDRHMVGGKAGFITNVPTNAFVILSDMIYVQPLSETQMRIQSTSTQDSNTGTGIRQLYFIYFNQLWIKKTIIIDLNGTTPVLTPSDVFRIETIKAKIVGSFGFAVGTISVTSISGVDIYARILPGRNFFERCLHYVQKGYSSHMMEIKLNSFTADRVTFRMFRSEEDESGNLVNIGQDTAVIKNQEVNNIYMTPIIVFNPNGIRTSIGIAVKGDTAGGIASGAFRFIDLQEIPDGV